ncbi:HEAT repeat domain-containing protein [Fibrobacterota bacterium]
MKTLEDADAGAACAAAGALAKMGEKKGFSAVKGFLSHKDEDVKIQTNNVLAEIAGPEARESLQKLLKEEKDPDSKRYVTKTMNTKLNPS